MRRRVVPAPPERVYDLVADPDHLPRWWPGVQRVEDATPEAWTKVFVSPRGRSLRADFTRLEAAPPERIRWRQEIAASPFERFMAESVTTIELRPAGDGTEVSIRIAQRLRGLARLGGLMVRRATRRQLDEALAGLGSVLA